MNRRFPSDFFLPQKEQTGQSPSRNRTAPTTRRQPVSMAYAVASGA
jgi:hypothetical protein